MIINRFGRENFTEAMKIAHRTDLSLIDWNKFKYMAFDIPNHKGTYQERYTQLGMYAYPTLLCSFFSREFISQLQM